MNTVLKNMLISFATGASFTLGVLAIMVTYQLTKEQRTIEPSTKITTPDDLSIVEHELVPDQEKFTVRGVIENKGDSVWPFAFLEMRVYSGDALMSGCNADVDGVQPNSSRNFILTCSTTHGRNLPENMTYIIEIPWAFHWTLSRSSASAYVCFWPKAASRVVNC